MKFDEKLVALRFDVDSDLVAREWTEFNIAKIDGWWKVDDIIKADVFKSNCARISNQAVEVKQIASELQQAEIFLWDSNFPIDGYECATVQIDDHLLMTYNLGLVKPQTDDRVLLFNEVTIAQRFTSEQFKTSNSVVITDTDGHAWLKVGGELFPKKDAGGCVELLPSDERLANFESAEHQTLMYFDSLAVAHLNRAGCLRAEIDGTTWMKYDDQTATLKLTADLSRLHAQTNLGYKEISKLPVSYKLPDSKNMIGSLDPLLRGFISFGKTVLKIVVKSNIPLPVAP
jgi:hypothetical protein